MSTPRTRTQTPLPTYEFNPETGTAQAVPADALTDTQLDTLKSLVAEATGVGQWGWSGNVDHNEPTLSTWRPGWGRVNILSIGDAERTTDSRRYRELVSYLDECDYDSDARDYYINAYLRDAHGEPMTDPRLWMYTDGLAVDARDHAVYEVAPDATRRDDPNVYRADIVGINHPDAELITYGINLLPALIARLEAAEAALAAAVND